MTSIKLDEKQEKITFYQRLSGLFFKAGLIAKPKFRVSRTLKIIVALLIFAGFLLINFKMVDPDLGWHLKIGEWIIKNSAVPHFDQFSFTMNGFRWVDHEWLSDAMLWLGYANHVWWLVVLFFTLAASFPFWWWLKRANSLLPIALIFLGAALASSIIGVRPQILSFLLFFIVYELLLCRFRADNKEKAGWRYLWSLPLLFFIWANLHGGFIAGLLIFAIFILVNLVIFYWRGQDGNKFVWRGDIFLFFLSIVAILANPYGLELYKEVFRVIFSADTTKYIAEWQPALSSFSAELAAVTTVFIFLCLKGIRKNRFDISCAAIIFFVLFLKSSRMMMFFLTAGMPLMIAGIESAKKEVYEAERKKTFEPKTLGLIGLVAALVIFFAVGIFIWRSINYRVFVLPEKAVAFLWENGYGGGNILNDYGWGGYLIWQLPNQKVFIDGRMPHWVDKDGNSAMEDYIKIFYSDNKNAWQDIFAKRKINIVLIPNQESSLKENIFWNRIIPSQPAKNFLEQFLGDKVINFFLEKKTVNLELELIKNGWKVIYRDNAAVVLIP